MTTGMNRGLTSYGDPEFSLFLRKAFLKAMGYSEDAVIGPSSASPIPPALTTHAMAPLPHW